MSKALRMATGVLQGSVPTNYMEHPLRQLPKYFLSGRGNQYCNDLAATLKALSDTHLEQQANEFLRRINTQMTRKGPTLGAHKAKAILPTIGGPSNAKREIENIVFSQSLYHSVQLFGRVTCKVLIKKRHGSSEYTMLT